MTMYGTSTPLNGNLDASTADVFGMSSFSLHKRRKGGDSFARWTTKAVLLSPLLILSLWSLIVMFSGTRKLQQTTPSQGMKIPMRPHSKQSGKLHVHPNHKGVTSQFASSERFMNSQQSGQQMVLQPPGLQQDQQQVQQIASSKNVSTRPHPHQRSISQEGKMIPIYVQMDNTQQVEASTVPQTSIYQEGKMAPILAPMGDAQKVQVSADRQGKMIPIFVPMGDAQKKQLSADPQTSIQQEGKMIPIYVPMGSTQEMQAAAVQQVALMNSQREKDVMNTEGSMMNTQGSNAMMANQMQLGEQVSTELGQEMMNTQSGDNTVVKANAMAASQSIGEELNEQIPVLNPLGSTDSNVVVRPLPQGSTSSKSSSSSTTTILYYDPAAATVNGQLFVPQVVYDADGNEVDLKALQASKNAEIYLEPPPITSTRKEAVTEDAPPQQMSRQDLERYAADPPAQDQYIIISTVAVMALLVGALSARRLRARNFLSSCIENESLEDEVAYDVATTNGDYSTFGGHWKGDLEKFDV